ncbi:MAG TPA: LpqB family beta-propeller domain-containing protein [Pyrinomonadaceae bacterium]|nr:LpqB family beta-propeller domain-containing protein [Pyrinomonadaceae bacterium]
MISSCVRLALRLALLLILPAIPFAVCAQPAVQPQAYFTDPSISPDGSEIAFVSGGDIWSVAAGGGDAHLLVSHPATESKPLYSPDGKKLAFVSTRTGNGDIYVLTLDTGDLMRLTFDDSADLLDAWSSDGRWIYFTSSTQDISTSDIFRVSSDGGTPMPVSGDLYTNEYQAAPSHDGGMVAFTGHGFGGVQWWRKGHSHIDESEIWIMRLGSNANYEQISEGHAKETWPMWSKDDRTIFYVSDRSGAQNIWARNIDGKPRQVTQFKDGRVLWPSIGYDGKTIVFERNFQIWKLDAANGRAAAVNIVRRGAPAGPAIDHLRLTEGISEMALSPDGKKIAFIVRGEAFAVSATEGGDAARVTTSTAEESQVAWSSDSRRLVYVSDRDGPAHLFLYDFASNTETRITNDQASDDTPAFSPDGKSIAFERAGEEIRVYDVDGKKEHTVAKAHLERPPLSSDRPFAWSPDSKWIAYVPVSDKGFKNVWAAPAAGGDGRQITFLSNTNCNTITWSPDGTFVLFDTNQRTEPGQVARVDLIPRTPRFREDQFRDLFKEETPRPPLRQNPPAPTPAAPTPAAPTPEPSPLSTPPVANLRLPGDARSKPAPKSVEIDFDLIRRRLALIPVGIDVRYQTISPDGKFLLMIAAVASQLNLYVYPLDELTRDPLVSRQLTSTAGFKAGAQFSPDSQEIFYLEGGRLNVIRIENRLTRPIAVTAELDVDFSREKMEVFQQAWTYIRDNFFEPNLNGVNWNAVHDQYAPLAAGARTGDELRRIISEMLGELNASHSGISGPANAAQPPAIGRLGVRFDRAEFENKAALKITEVIPLTPAAITNLKPGEYLLAVDGKTVSAHTNLDELLAYKIAKRTVLSIAASADGAQKREVVVRPISGAAERNLLYRKWIEDNRAYVAKLSNGRLGYVHMADMSAGALTQLNLDLDAENQRREGVVIDVRNNNGGFVNVYAIDVLARKSYFNMQPRGFTMVPSRTSLGQRALELPTVLVTNRHTLSDGEDFTEGYRSLRIGKVVGEPTAGWIIYTSGVQLIDGSNLRLPFDRITANDGELMEMHPRPVDVPVAKPVGESLQGKDSQLEAAVNELLKQIGAKK